MYYIYHNYTPEQNGVAERKNRSLMEMARCMLYDANMHIKFWAEAVNNANYIQNRLLSSAVKVTPFELWLKKTPNLSHVRMFGTVAYAHINKQKRRKLDDVSVKCYLVGYSDESKAYRLLNCETNKIIISRDVKFLELENSTELKDNNNKLNTNVIDVLISNPNPDILSQTSGDIEEDVDQISTDDFFGFESEDGNSPSYNSTKCFKYYAKNIYKAKQGYSTQEVWIQSLFKL